MATSAKSPLTTSNFKSARGGRSILLREYRENFISAQVGYRSQVVRPPAEDIVSRRRAAIHVSGKSSANTAALSFRRSLAGTTSGRVDRCRTAPFRLQCLFACAHGQTVRG